MSETDAVELIRLADEANSVIVRVLGRYGPGVLQLHDCLKAEIVVHSGFARGRLDVPLLADDLDAWGRALDALASWQSVRWMDDGRNPEVAVDTKEGSRYVTVTVTDSACSATSTRLAVRLADDWVSDHRERLRHVRAAWPSEVVTTDLGFLTWRRLTEPTT